MIINIRGTNGSGKTTLARDLIGERPNPIDLLHYPSPTKRDPERMAWVEGWGGRTDFIAVGSYKQGCGGLDTVPSFDLQQRAIRVAHDWKRENGTALMAGTRPRFVIAEGVLASTVFGSWGNFFAGFNKDEVLIAYLDTPLEVCLERITARQIAAKGEAREIKTDQVADKIRAINATRKRFDAAGFTTILLDHTRPAADLISHLHDLGA
ncbi:nucleoside triphosphate hydrolase [Pseudanabaena phage Pam3]|nr:nucleoside triphosphate hydrolase [Pseudanabaena phage Pam3]